MPKQLRHFGWFLLENFQIRFLRTVFTNSLNLCGFSLPPFILFYFRVILIGSCSEFVGCQDNSLNMKRYFLWALRMFLFFQWLFSKKKKLNKRVARMIHTCDWANSYHGPCVFHVEKKDTFVSSLMYILVHVNRT